MTTQAVARDGDDWLLKDAVGSVRNVVDNTGATVGGQDFSVFGEQLTGDGTFGFAGEQQDPTGLLHLRARDYNPSLGRFTSVDPVQPGAPGTTGYNLYAYSGNNPTTFTDPTGRAVLGEYKSTVSTVSLQVLVGITRQQAARILARELLREFARQLLQNTLTTGSGAYAPPDLSRPPLTNPPQLEETTPSTPVVEDPVPATVPSTGVSNSSQTDDDDRDRTCATQYPDHVRQALALQARNQAEALGPIPTVDGRQTIGVLYVCDSSTLELRGSAGAQFDLTSEQGIRAKSAGLSVSRGEGLHAEETLLRTIGVWEEPLAIGVTNNFCTTCGTFLTVTTGAVLLDPFGADRGRKGAYWPAAA